MGGAAVILAVVAIPSVAMVTGPRSVLVLARVVIVSSHISYIVYFHLHTLPP